MDRKKSHRRILTLLSLLLSGVILTMATLTFVQAEGSAASILIAKEADPTVVNVGDTVNYTITVDNTGTENLANVNVDDDLVGCSLNGPVGDDGDRVLQTDEIWTYTCSVIAGSEDIVNTATVSATYGTSGTVSHFAVATVDVIHPGVRIVKMADPTLVNPGETVVYTITVANTGDSYLSDVTVDDHLEGCTLAGPTGDTHNPGVLDRDETWAYTCSLIAGNEDIENTATVDATDEAGGTVTDWDRARADVIHPNIEIAKMPDVQMVAGDDPVDFTIAVTNTGDVTLTNVTVSDARVSECDRTFPELLAWEHQTYNCTASPVDGGFINSAVVTGSLPGGEEVTDVDAARVRLEATHSCPSGIIAYWWLDEITGTAHHTTYEEYIYGHHGGCAGQCPDPEPGQIDGGQAFDSDTETGIDVPVVPGDDSFDWGAQDSFSIEFWLQPDSDGCSGNQVVVGRDDGSTDLHWWAGCWAGGKAAFILGDRDGGEDTQVLVGTTDLTDGDWHHIVAVRDGSEDENSLYVDGMKEAFKSEASYSTGFDSLTAALNIGWLDLLHGYHFDGIVDEIALYARALSSSEIRQHYNEGLAGRWYCETGEYAPVIVSTPVTEATVGRLYTYDVEAAGDPVPTYTLVSHPSGMTIDSATGLISWVPTVAQKGNHDVEVEASNSVGASTQPFTISVSEGTLCPTGMIAYWKLDETGGATYDDFYDGHNGECPAGRCPESVTGRIQGGQEFDGSDEIDVPAVVGGDFLNWGAHDSFSIEFWLQLDSTSTYTGNQVVVGRNGGSTDLHWWVGCWAGGTAAFVLGDRDGGDDTQVLVGITDLTDGSWYHIVAVRDGSRDENRLYVNGREEASVGSAGYSSGFDSLAAELNMGWLDVLAHDYHFRGIADEVALYDRALSAGEIEQHFNDGEIGPGYCINPDIAVHKTANPAVAYPGNVVTYTYTVTNAGDAPLSAVSLSDDKCSPVICAEGGTGRLNPAEAWTYHCAMELGTDITNTVTVTGSPSLGEEVHGRDAVFVNVINPAIAIDKVADPTLIYAGDTVVYTYTVTNPGDDPLSHVGVTDDQCGPVGSAGGDNNGNYALDPGETWIYTCSTILSTGVASTATATGTDSAGKPVSATDTGSTLTILKVAGDGDTVFEFTVACGSGKESINLRNGGWAQLADLVPNSYTITETVASEWQLVSIACTNGISLSAPHTPAVTVDLQSGQDVSCTFTNRKEGSYQIYLPLVLRVP